MWKSNWKKTIKTVISVFFAIIVVVAALSPEIPDAESSANHENNSVLQSYAEREPTENNTDKQAGVAQDAKIPLPSIEDIKNQITDTLVEKGYSVENASTIQKILNTIGIKSIDIQSMSGGPSKGLNAIVCYPNGLTDENSRIFFTTDNGILFYAGFKNEDLYDLEKGGFLKNYNDVHVPETEIFIEVYEQLKTMSESEIESYTNFPETANFKMLNWGVGRSDDSYQIRGKVVAENAHGFEGELSFSVWFEKNGEDYTVIEVLIEAKKIKQKKAQKIYEKEAGK